LFIANRGIAAKIGLGFADVLPLLSIVSLMAYLPFRISQDGLATCFEQRWQAVTAAPRPTCSISAFGGSG
jgi:hypothetical protein